MVDQSHPYYHEGFFDALDNTPIHDDADPIYRAGWEAAMRSKDIFRNAGFSQDGRSFSAGSTITSQPRGSEAE
ncbi:hypothetical protein [Tardiphaga sp.]|jgi:hypothetical protein|uniref:hypothetical protein n=1 Tax=Tardiphaga sp. TaxID=1926292 RepID=UPI0037DA6C86